MRTFGIRVIWVTVCLASAIAWAQSGVEKVIIDTDIGDDVDDAFAVALAIKSPELQVLGLTTTFGDTETRARIVDRLLGEVGRTEIPVLAGKATSTKNPMSQRRYAENHRFTKSSHGDAASLFSIRFASIRGRLR